MRPDQCGFGRNPSTLAEGDRKAVEDFKRFLAGELAYAEDGITYVAPDDPRATYFGFGGKPEDGS